MPDPATRLAIAHKAPPDPVLTSRAEDGHDVPLLVWRLSAPVRAISSAVLGGGLGPCEWLINASVPMSYDRDDPADHLAAIAVGLGLRGPGVGLLTGVDVTDVVSATDGGVRLWATVGLGVPIQAAAHRAPGAPDRRPASPPRPGPAPAPANSASVRSTSTPSLPEIPDLSNMGGVEGVGSAEGVGGAGDGMVSDVVPAGSAGDAASAYTVGTVNVVAWVPERLSDGALVNAVATVTEAKTQAIRELGLDATGTATDAVCVLCPVEGPIAEYGGPRSTWGARLARAAYAAVLDGGKAGTQSWSDRVSGR